MRRGYYGNYGGRYVPETLIPALEELEQAFEKAWKDATFREELRKLHNHYTGRPSPLYCAENLSRHLGGATIYLKREDCNHTGAHKINNALAQVLLAKSMGKKTHHRRDRGGAARGSHRHRGGPIRPGVRGLHGRKGHSTPEA